MISSPYPPGKGSLRRNGCPEATKRTWFASPTTSSSPTCQTKSPRYGRPTWNSGEKPSRLRAARGPRQRRFSTSAKDDSRSRVRCVAAPLSGSQKPREPSPAISRVAVGSPIRRLQLRLIIRAAQRASQPASIVLEGGRRGYQDLSLPGSTARKRPAPWSERRRSARVGRREPVAARSQGMECLIHDVGRKPQPRHGVTLGGGAARPRRNDRARRRNVGDAFVARRQERPACDLAGVVDVHP